jgi:membrane-associated phospholipid phosphatase
MRSPAPRPLTAILLAALVLAIPAPARAQTPAPEDQPDSSFEDWGGFLAAGGAVALMMTLDAPECRWCDRGPNGEDTLNAFDRRARGMLLWPEAHRRTAARLSDVLAGSMVAVPYLLLWPADQHADAIQTMAWVVAADTALTAIPKRLFARERPHAHFKDTSASSAHPNASFFSNHTSLAFSSLAASIRMCDIIACGHNGRIWAVGLPIAALTGLLRIAADRHYATDVLAGAAAGAAIGWYIPALTDTIERRSTSPTQPTGGTSFAMTMRFAW